MNEGEGSFVDLRLICVALLLPIWNLLLQLIQKLLFPLQLGHLRFLFPLQQRALHLRLQRPAQELV